MEHFSLSEKTLVARFRLFYGDDWKKIARHLPGRTPEMIKSYWNQKQRHERAIRNMSRYHLTSFYRNETKAQLKRPPAKAIGTKVTVHTPTTSLDILAMACWWALQQESGKGLS